MNTKDMFKLALAVEYMKEVVSDGNWIPEICEAQHVVDPWGVQPKTVVCQREVKPLSAVEAVETLLKEFQVLHGAAGILISSSDTAWALCREETFQALFQHFARDCAGPNSRFQTIQGRCAARGCRSRAGGTGLRGAHTELFLTFSWKNQYKNDIRCLIPDIWVSSFF